MICSRDHDLQTVFFSSSVMFFGLGSLTPAINHICESMFANLAVYAAPPCKIYL